MQIRGENSVKKQMSCHINRDNLFNDKIVGLNPQKPTVLFLALSHCDVSLQDTYPS